MSCTGHFSVQRGKKVKVFLKDGTNFIARFKEKKGKYILFYDHKEINSAIARTLTIYKPRI